MDGHRYQLKLSDDDQSCCTTSSRPLARYQHLCRRCNDKWPATHDDHLGLNDQVSSFHTFSGNEILSDDHVLRSNTARLGVVELTFCSAVLSEHGTVTATGVARSVAFPSLSQTWCPYVLHCRRKSYLADSSGRSGREGSSCNSACACMCAHARTPAKTTLTLTHRRATAFLSSSSKH